MPNRYESEISFTCPRCGRFVTTKVEVPELNFTAERASENVSEGNVEIVCPSCETPFSGFCFNSMGDCEITFDDFPDVEVSAQLAEYPPDEDWVAYEAPDDPKANFMDSYHHAGDLLAEHGGGGAHLVNRMVFAQQIGALEAYLADTLINFVTNNPEAMKRLIAGDPDLRNKKFTLTEIEANKKLVDLEVLSHLRSILYHNLPKVRALYKTIADVDLFDLLGPSKEKLFKAVEYRHDCVHRNGRDSKGNLLEVFSKEYVQETADLMKELVFMLDAAVHRSPNREPSLDDDLPF